MKNTASGVAADLQLAAGFSDTDLVEYLVGSVSRDGIRTGKWRLDEQGFLEMPDGPGLGIALDANEVEKYSGVTRFCR